MARGSRSRSSSRKDRRHRDRSRSDSRNRQKRSRRRSRDRSESTERSSRQSSKALTLDSEHLEDKAVAIVAKEIKKFAEQEVARYLHSDEYKSMVETMKRNERERAYREIQQIIAAERDVMLQQEREKLALEKNAMRQAEEILAENQRKIEEQRRLELEAKQKADAERLQLLLQRQEEESSQYQRQLQKGSIEKDKRSATTASKVSFGLKKSLF